VINPYRNEVSNGFAFEHSELMKAIPEHFRDAGVENAERTAMMRKRRFSHSEPLIPRDELGFLLVAAFPSSLGVGERVIEGKV